MHGASWVSAGSIFDCQVRKYPSVLQGEQEIVGLTRSGMKCTSTQIIRTIHRGIVAMASFFTHHLHTRYR